MMKRTLILGLLALLAVGTLGAQSRPAARPSRSAATRQPVSRPAPRVAAVRHPASNQPAPRAQNRRPTTRVVRSRTVTARTYRSYRSYGYGDNYNYNNYGYNQYGYAPLPRPSGMKFDLELVSEKDRKMVRQGKVFIDSLDKGIVGRYDGGFNKSLKYPSGTYEVEVRLKDGRTFNTTIEILPEQIAPVYPEFN